LSRFRRRAKAALSLTAALCLLLAGGGEAAGGDPDRDVRLRVESLASAGLMETVLLGTRPFSRGEAARLLDESREQEMLDRVWKAMSGERVGPNAWAERHREGLERESGQWRVSAGRSYLRPIGPAGLRYVFLDGPPSPIPGIKASSHALVYNNGGIEPEEGANAYADFVVEGGLGPLSMHVNPLFTVDGQARGEVHRGWLRLGLLGLDIEAGKIGLWWGQGYHGGLFLTSKAEPLPMVRVTNPSPALLPWVFGRLGPFRLDLFAARLEEGRDIPEPYFTGMRVNFKPHPALEVGLTRTIILGGRGRPGVTPERLAKILFGGNRELGEDLSNSITGMDLRLTLPGVQLYGELGGEDEAGGLPFEFAYLAGLFVAVPGTSIDFRVEYADITNTLWYRHSLYSSGYTYRGRILGHHAGRGARDVFAEMGVTGDRLSARFNIDYEERGTTTEPVTERHYQFGMDWKARIGRFLSDWRIGVGFGYDRVINAGYTRGADRSDLVVSVALTGVN